MMTLAILYVVVISFALLCMSFFGRRGATWDRAAQGEQPELPPARSRSKRRRFV